MLIIKQEHVLLSVKEILQIEPIKNVSMSVQEALTGTQLQVFAKIIVAQGF